MRIVCSHSTVSQPAFLVVAGVIPIDLLATTRKSVRECANGVSKCNAKIGARRTSMRCWQNRWDMESQERWEAGLIGQLVPWLLWKHGEVDFFLTQFLSNHGFYM